MLHPPSVYDFRKVSVLHGPISDVIPSTPIFEMYPIGFASLSEYLGRFGIKVRIINLAYKMLKSKGYDAEKEIRRIKARAFGIDLHWMPHIQGAIAVSELVKKHHPDTPVIFGGLSSTYFHEELLERYESIDYRGAGRFDRGAAPASHGGDPRERDALRRPEPFFQGQGHGSGQSADVRARRPRLQPHRLPAYHKEGGEIQGFCRLRPLHQLAQVSHHRDLHVQGLHVQLQDLRRLPLCLQAT